MQWIKNPPQEYAEKIQAPYDVRAEFEDIYEKAVAGTYASEYQFGFALYECFQRTHDGHFVVYPDSVNGIFSFGRTTPLVSVSLDGTSIPEVFVYSDILETTVGNASFTPSPLTLIDGQNSTEYLLNWAQYGSLQDRDALWNNVFYLLATVSLGPSGSGTGTFSGGGRGRWIYPGESTTLTFANGSEVTNQNFARVLSPFDNITSGADIYKEYFAVPSGSVMPAYELAVSTHHSDRRASRLILYLDTDNNIVNYDNRYDDCTSYFFFFNRCEHNHTSTRLSQPVHSRRQQHQLWILSGRRRVR